jgi:hypothetical protein
MNVARTLAALGVVTVLLTGCAAPGEPAETGPEPAVWGVESASFPLPESLATAEYVGGFSAGGVLWVYDSTRDAPPVLHGTRDGVEWVTLDLVAAGLPADAFLGSDSHCPVSRAIEDRGEEFTIVYATWYGGSHSSGLANRFFLVDIDTAAMEVLGISDAAENGLEVMPPAAASDGYNFRTYCIAGFARLGGTRLAVGGGQWWLPYLTSTADGFVATEDASGRWSVRSEDGAPFYRTLRVQPAGVFPVGDVLVVPSKRYDAPSGFDAWVSADGVSWEHIQTPGPVPGYYDLNAVAGPAGIVVVAPTEDPEAIYAWSSADGRSWTAVRLSESERMAPGFLVATEDGYVAGFEDGFDMRILTSADGVEWVPVEQDEAPPIWLRYAFRHGTGLVSVSKDAILTTGLDWSQPTEDDDAE